MLGVVFLLGLRIGLNVLNSNVIDVGYAGVIGADKLIHGHLLYGHWPSDNAYGDTYGPVNYFAYVPFRLIFGWSGTWDSLPGRPRGGDRVRPADGRRAVPARAAGFAATRSASILMYAWVAYPFTLFALNSNTNDALVSALLVLRAAGDRLASGARRRSARWPG